MIVVLACMLLGGVGEDLETYVRTLEASVAAGTFAQAFAEKAEVAMPAREGKSRAFGPVSELPLAAGTKRTLAGPQLAAELARFTQGYEAIERVVLRFEGPPAPEAVLWIELGGRAKDGWRVDRGRASVRFVQGEQGWKLDRFVVREWVRQRAKAKLFEELAVAWPADPTPSSATPPPAGTLQPDLLAVAYHPGVAVADVNADGFDDLFAWDVGGRSRLLENQAGKGFADATERYGLGFYGVSAALFADYNADGAVDLVLGRYAGRSEVYYGERGRFVPGEMNRNELLPGNVSAIAAGDVNKDGLLDLYFGTAYAPFHGNLGKLLEKPLTAAELNVSEPELAELQGALPAARAAGGLGDGAENRFGPPNRLYVNSGAGLWVDRTAGGGVEAWRETIAAAFADLDGDGRHDLLLANDRAPATAYFNSGERFASDPAAASWTWITGLAIDDLDGDGDLDVFMSAARDSRLLRNDGKRKYTDLAASPAFGSARAPGWGFSPQLVDADSDGLLDLYVPTGLYTGAEPAEDRAGRQRDAFLLNRGKELIDAAYLAGTDAVEDGRVAAHADFDRDGHEDLVLMNRNAPLLRVFLNRAGPASGHDWIGLKLEGAQGGEWKGDKPASSRDPVGAFVAAKCGARKVGRAYARTTTIGLGKCPKVDTLTVRWPGGTEQSFKGVKPRRMYRLREGAQLEELAGVYR